MRWCLLVGARLAELRKERGMTQRELSKLLSVSVTTISGYENDQNNPNDEIKVHIARIFNVSLDYLLGVVDEEVLISRENVIVLPKSFPIKARKDVEEYAKLLCFKFKQII